MGGGVKEGEETTKKERERARERTASLPAHVDIWSVFLLPDAKHGGFFCSFQGEDSDRIWFRAPSRAAGVLIPVYF